MPTGSSGLHLIDNKIKIFFVSLLTLSGCLFASAVLAQAAIPVDHELMQKIMPEADSFSAKEGDPPVYRAYKTVADGSQELIGYLFETPDLPPEEIGYAAPVDVLVGMDLEGTVTGIEIVYYVESYRSIRGDFLHSERFPDQFEDKHLTEGFRVGRDVDGVSRATISSWAVARGIRNAARRVAMAYLEGVEGLSTPDGGALSTIQAMTWEDMKANGLITDLTVTYPEDTQLMLSFVYIGDEVLAELILGPNDYSTAEREASNRTNEGQLMLVGIAGNSNSSGNPFRPERLAIRQGDKFFPIPRRQFVYAGSATEGKIVDQVNFAGAVVLDQAIDITQPFSLEYDNSADMGSFENVVSAQYTLPPVALALVQGLPWEDPDADRGFDGTGETGFARLVNEAPWDQVAFLLILFGLVMAAFLLKNSGVRWVALAATLGYLGFFDGGFLSISHITSALKVGPSMYLNDAPLLLLIVFTLVTTLLWGRIFCSSLCPFGALQDFIAKLMPNRFQLKVPAWIHDRAIYIKYGILALIVLVTLVAADVSIFQYFEPFGTLFFWSRSSLLWAILVLFLLGTIFINRFYCRYLCPLGAALGLVSIISPFKIKRVAQCDICKVCEHACPTGAIRGPAIDFKECVRCDLCEIKLIAKSGVCKHNMEDLRSRVKDWQPVTLS